MKLLDLDPRWIVAPGNFADMANLKIGITFRCPHCPPGTRGATGFLGVFFSNPIDPDDVARLIQWGIPQPGERPLWRREGDSFANLSLSPSIDVSSSGHWHGHITNGELR